MRKFFAVSFLLSVLFVGSLFSADKKNAAPASTSATASYDQPQPAREQLDYTTVAGKRLSSAAWAKSAVLRFGPFSPLFHSLRLMDAY